MQVLTLIEKLKALHGVAGNVTITIDHTPNDYYELEAVELKHFEEEDVMIINLKSLSEK